MGFLITLLIAAVIIYLITYVANQITMPQPVRVILYVIVILYLLGALTHVVPSFGGF